VPGFERSAEDFLAFCRAEGLVVTDYATLNRDWNTMITVAAPSPPKTPAGAKSPGKVKTRKHAFGSTPGPAAAAGAGTAPVATNKKRSIATADVAADGVAQLSMNSPPKQARKGATATAARPSTAPPATATADSVPAGWKAAAAARPGTAAPKAKKKV
jgi:hypothetical protein